MSVNRSHLGSAGSSGDGGRSGSLEWLRSTAVLYVLTQIPMIAFLTGYLWGWTSFSTATIAGLYLAFILTPLWVLREKNRSRSSSDPVHNLALYSMWALIPYTVYDLARIPAYLFGSPYWDRWYDFGAELAGGPPDSWSALITGTLVHSIQGWVLGLGYFVLFRRHTLAGSLAYLFLFLSLAYSWLFVSFAKSDPTPIFFFTVFWSHLWMAIAAWGAAKLIRSRRWRRIPSTARGVAVGGAGVVCSSPFVVAFWEAAAVAS